MSQTESKGKILVVEPDEDLQFWFKYHLTAAGYNLAIAVDEATTVELLDEFKPIVTILNVDALNQDAIDRLIHPKASTRFIVISKDDSRETIRNFLEKGVDRLMSYSLHDAEILGELHSIIRSVEALKKG